MQASAWRNDMTRLDLNVGSVGSVPCLTVAGELGLAEVDGFEAALATVEQPQPPIILLDLRRLDLIDSSGLSALLDADARARADGRRVLLTRPPEQIMRVLRLTLLDRRFSWFDGSSLDGEEPSGRPALAGHAR